MKLSLIVTNPGKMQGQAIPIGLAQFVIGRDPQCNLRPASALISKRHCALLVRDGKVFLRDFDSTNGTFVNEIPVKDEVELHAGDFLKVGPLAFTVKIESGAVPVNRPTPAPPTKKPSGDKAAPALSDDESVAAMLLSLQEDGNPVSASASPSEIPEGSTVMEILTVPPGEPTAKEKAAAAVKKVNTGNTSTAAKAILEKYMRRPRGG
jgi:predicted component of type VI protein secretion system